MRNSIRFLAVLVVLISMCFAFASCDSGSSSDDPILYAKWDASLPSEALSGTFSVSATKKVHFSKGNLRAKKVSGVWAWGFYDNQYDCNSMNTGEMRIATAGDDEIDLFTWGYNETKSVNPVGSDGDNVSRREGNLDPATEDWGCKIGTAGTWRTLSNDEWIYLFNTRYNAASKIGYATVGGVKGIIILPDSFTDPMKNNGSGAFVSKALTGWTQNVYTAGDNWNAMESAGAVFLPAAGFRSGPLVLVVGDLGSYSSSSVANSYSHRAYTVCFYSYRGGSVGPVSDDASRENGYSVRLVCEEQ